MLIDKQKVIERLEDMFERKEDLAPRWIKHTVLNILADIPGEDAEPIRNAEWIMDEDGNTYCSHCGKYSYDTYDEVSVFRNRTIYVTTLPYYCGYCGSKMEEAEQWGDN